MQEFLEKNKLKFAAKHGRKPEIKIKSKNQDIKWADEEFKKPKEKQKWG